MRVPALLVFCCLQFSFADTVGRNLPKENPFFESSTGLKQITKLMSELQNTMGNIPPEVEKIAVYQIRTEPGDFSPSVSRYIQGMIETTFKEYARVAVVSPPELKTLSIVSTDTSFSLSNTIPTLGELWKLGDRLKIDAFLQGSCGKSEDGDILLNLKLIKHKTAEILWSGDFIAGPNKTTPSIWDLKWAVSLPVGYLPVESFSDPANRTIRPKSPHFNVYGFRGSVHEALIQSKRIWFSVNGGFSMLSFAKEDTVNVRFKTAYSMNIGIEALAVIIAKPNIDRGYWLGTYIGGCYSKPFSFRGAFPGLSLGYKSQVSQHFAISMGAIWIPGQRKITGTGLMPGTKDILIEVGTIAYEFNILNFTF